MFIGVADRIVRSTKSSPGGIFLLLINSWNMGWSSVNREVLRPHFISIPQILFEQAVGPLSYFCVTLDRLFLLLKIWSFFLFVIFVTASSVVIWCRRCRCDRHHFRSFLSPFFSVAVLGADSSFRLWYAVVLLLFLFNVWCVFKLCQTNQFLQTQEIPFPHFVVRTNNNFKVCYWKSHAPLYFFY